MVAELDDRTSEVTEYILQQQESLGDDLQDMLVDISGDTHIDVIRSLQLEYALDPDATDDVLLVNLDSGGDVLTVTSAD